jgi:uncharacterized protein (DUF427 family)
MTEPLRTEPTAKRIRTYLGGELVADTTRALLVWEVPYYPAYYLPVADIRDDVLVPSRVEDGVQHLTVKAGGTEAIDGARVHPAVPDHIRFEWRAMDGWFEEDDEVFVHPRDPHTRVDALRSSRRVRVEIDGVVLAETDHPTVLFETGLPPRYYLPKVDVRMDLLEPTETETSCPYKGTARYWSARVGDRLERDIAWSYPTPLPESAPVAGLVSFYNERVDLVVDGEPVDRPHTPFS